jgi:hypothetical protein
VVLYQAEVLSRISAVTDCSISVCVVFSCITLGLLNKTVVFLSSILVLFISGNFGFSMKFYELL